MATSSTTEDELAPFILHDVEGLESGEKKGAGAYGAVYEVSVRGVPCFAKRVHDILVNQEVSRRERTALQQKFHQECVIHSKLKHPNIVHFVGVHYGKGLSLIMERLHTDLGNYLDTHPNIPLPIKLSILLDVSYGLLYLHTTPIIHRDLTANNILLTSDMRAKIADLGVSKLIDLHAQTAATHSKVPGSWNYMPPEALKERSVYGVKLDVFSFGHLALYTATQNFPKVFEVTLTAAVIQSGELQILKRRRAIDEMGERHCLYPLTIQCLKDDPSQRPTTPDLITTLRELCTKHPKSLIELQAGEAQKDIVKEHQEHAEAFRMQQDQISSLKRFKADLLNDLEAARAEVLIYKEDFEKERQDRAKAFGKMDELREQRAKEMPVLQEEVGHLHKELVVHQQRLEEVELMAMMKEKEAVRVEQELRRAQEEVRAKTSQVKQYKKQVDQLKAQLTDLEGQNFRLIETMEAVRKELEKTKSSTKLAQKLAIRKKKPDRSLASPEQPMSMPLQTESTLAKAESQYERERDKNDVLRGELEKIQAQQKKLHQENAQLRQMLESTSVPRLLPRIPGQSMPQMVGHLDAEHHALHVHSQEKIKQQLQQQFAQQREGDPRCAKTELLPVGGGGFVPAQPGGSAAAAIQHDQPVLRAAGGVPTHPGQPRAAVDPRFQSNAGPQPPISAPHHREAYRQRSHSDTEPRSGLTHPPIPQEYPQGQAYEMGELHHGVDTAIQHVAKDVISAVDDESGRHIVTQQHVPHDPNLTCPYCEKQFRMGEIQKYRHHVKSCTGTGGTVV